MGKKNLPKHCEKLIQIGKDPNTPALYIEGATTIEQKVIRGNLVTLSDKGKNSLQEITGIIKNIPGIAYCLPSIRTEPHIDKINELALAWLKQLSFETFRITARKSDHQFSVCKKLLSWSSDFQESISRPHKMMLQRNSFDKEIQAHALAW